MLLNGTYASKFETGWEPRVFMVSYIVQTGAEFDFLSRKIVQPKLTENFPFKYILKSKFSLSRHFEYANEQITYHFWLCSLCWRDRVAQWVRLTTHTSLSPIRRGFVPCFVNTQKGALDSQPQVIKFTSCFPMVGGSLRVLRLPPPLKLVAMI